MKKKTKVDACIGSGELKMRVECEAMRQAKPKERS